MLSEDPVEGTKGCTWSSLSITERSSRLPQVLKGFLHVSEISGHSICERQDFSANDENEYVILGIDREAQDVLGLKGPSPASSWRTSKHATLWSRSCAHFGKITNSSRWS